MLVWCSTASFQQAPTEGAHGYDATTVGEPYFNMVDWDGNDRIVKSLVFDNNYCIPGTTREEGGTEKRRLITVCRLWSMNTIKKHGNSGSVVWELGRAKALTSLAGSGEQACRWSQTYLRVDCEIAEICEEIYLGRGEVNYRQLLSQPASVRWNISFGIAKQLMGAGSFWTKVTRIDKKRPCYIQGTSYASLRD